MAVLVTMTAVGMDAARYDQVSERLGKLIVDQPGFLMHVAYPSEGGFAVGEVWETPAEFEAWYTENVQPNVPGISAEITELHSVLQGP